MRWPALLAPLLLCGLAPGWAQDAAPSASFSLAVRGLAVQLHRAEPGHDYRPHLVDLPALGASHVLLAVKFFQRDARSPAPSRQPGRDLSDPDLLRVIAQARERGLSVILMPMLLLAEPGKDEWRGSLAPPDWGRWFEGYERVLLHWARLAQESQGVSCLVVGTELSSSEGQTERWRALIAKVRRVYGGALTYGANWDHYRQVGFWNDLDWVGLSAYYSLSRSEEPALDELTAAWGAVRDQLLAWRVEARVRPRLLFLELGYPSLRRCATTPWDYTTGAPVDLEAQHRCYQAFERAWARVPELGGVIFWEWWGEGGGEQDGSYSPRGKPALEVIKRVLGGR